jgi:hypothetical protein
MRFYKQFLNLTSLGSYGDRLSSGTPLAIVPISASVLGEPDIVDTCLVKQVMTEIQTLSRTTSMSEPLEKPAAVSLPPVEQPVEFKFSLTGLSFEYKGPSHRAGQALQHGLQQSLNGLMNTQRVVLAEPEALPALPITYTPAPEPPGATPTTPGPTPTNGHATNGDKPRKTRKPRGPSVTTLLREVIKEGFFREPRLFGAIRQKLKDKGHNPPTNRLGDRLKELVQKSELFRQKSGEDYAYKDTKFDDTPRSADAPDEARD